jgi:activator of HSP90 ATPase
VRLCSLALRAKLILLRDLAGHEATLTTTFAQSTDSTTVTFELVGVPTGMEDELRRNLEGY